MAKRARLRIPRVTAAKSEWSLGRRPALDGLRAFAIIAVMGVHLGTVLDPGNIGVDFRDGVLGVNMFFVISGFLITALLLQEYQRAGRIDLAAFWKRRALRLFPALYVVLVAQMVYTLHVHDPLPYTLKGDGVIVGYVSNWAWAFNWPLPFGLDNTWSLGVEEQFYVVWPLLLFLLLKLRRGWLIPILALAVAVTSAILRAELWNHTLNYLQATGETQVNLDGLMGGATLAWLMHAGWKPPMRLIRLLAVPAAVYLAWTIWNGNPPVGAGPLWHLPMPMAALATIVLIIASLEPVGIPYHVLNFAPLRWVGRLSYSLYVWHFFLFSWLYRSYHFPNPVKRAVAGVAFAFIAATLSYYLVERPCVRFAHRRRAAADIGAGRQAEASLSSA